MPLHVANLITQNGCLTSFSQELITFSIAPCQFAASDFCVFFPPTSKLWLPSCPGTLWQNKPTNMLMNNSNFSPVMYENRDAKETPVASVGSTRLNLSGAARRGSPQLSSSRGGGKKTTHIVLELMETMESDHTIVSTSRFVNWRGQERRDAAKPMVSYF